MRKYTIKSIKTINEIKLIAIITTKIEQYPIR